MEYPQHLTKLINVLRKLPGVGLKSAERYAFQFLDWEDGDLKEMADVIGHVKERLRACSECGCLIDERGCSLCVDARYRLGSICVITSPKEAFSIEETGEYRGLYHVLGGVLSPMEGIGPDKLTVDKLKERIDKHQIREVVIALDSTLEGDTTALYIKKELASRSVEVSRLAFGLPMGSSLDYVDGGTLARAFSGRASF